LHLACAYGQKDVVKALLEEKADARAEDTDGNAPLDVAEANGYDEIAELLASQLQYK
jgi:ankyrin repeat protein